MINSIF